MTATSEVAFFVLFLVYTLLGLTYNFKVFDRFIVGLWISYFLFTFRQSVTLKNRGITRELKLLALESKSFIQNRTNTSQFIRDVDFAFKGVQV